MGSKSCGFGKGVGWYRKSFIIDRKDAHKLHSLYFEGVYAQSEVWVNGQKVKFNAYGYSSFKCDITSYCHPAGEVNTIAVKVTNEGKNSRWYAGSGIYRHVWLIKTDPVHLDEWGVAVRTDSLCAVHGVPGAIKACSGRRPGLPGG